MVEGRVEEHAGIVPGRALDSDGLMESTDLLKLFIDNDDVVLAKESSVKSIVRPDDVFDATNSEFGEILLLLQIVEDEHIARKQEEGSCGTREDVGRICGGFDGFGNHIAQVLHMNLLACLVEYRKAIASDEDSRIPRTTFGVGRFKSSRGISRQID